MWFFFFDLLMLSVVWTDVLIWIILAFLRGKSYLAVVYYYFNEHFELNLLIFYWGYLQRYSHINLLILCFASCPAQQPAACECVALQDGVHGPAFHTGDSVILLLHFSKCAFFWQVESVVCMLSRFSRVRLCYPIDYSPRGSSDHGILQARILELVATSFSRDLPDPGIERASPALAGRICTTSTTCVTKHPKANGLSNGAAVPWPVLTVASWPAYRFLKRQVRWSGIPISFRIFRSLLWSTQSRLWHSQ